MAREIEIKFKLVEIAALLLVLAPKDKNRSDNLDRAIKMLENASSQEREPEGV